MGLAGRRAQSGGGDGFLYWLYRVLRNNNVVFCLEVMEKPLWSVKKLAQRIMKFVIFCYGLYALKDFFPTGYGLILERSFEGSI